MLYLSSASMPLVRLRKIFCGGGDVIIDIVSVNFANILIQLKKKDIFVKKNIHYAIKSIK